MGNKAQAKSTMEAAGVPCVPGSKGLVNTFAEGKKIAKKIYIGQKEWGRADILEQKKHKGRTTVLMRLFQGKKREIRRIVYRMKKTLFSLKRVQFGPIQLDDTPLGASRELNGAEIKLLNKL